MVKDFPLYPLEKILRKAGAERVSLQATQALKEILLEQSDKISRDAVKLADHAKRVTIKRCDIVLASK
jgi:histone H3/H4